jgi:hypothetical protein
MQTLSTCRPDYENNPDYIKCFDCNHKNNPRCNFRPSNSSSSQIWCNIKKKKCFSKAVYKSPKNLLESFVRGCATVKELVGSNILISNSSRGFCYHNSNSTKACVIFCGSNFCNKEVTGRANSRVVTVRPIRPLALRLQGNHSTQKKNNLSFVLLKIILAQAYYIYLF